MNPEDAIRPDSSGADRSRTTSDLSALPTALLEMIPARLRLATLVYAAAFGANVLLSWVTELSGISDAPRASFADQLVGPAFIVVSLGLYFYVRFGNPSSRAIRWLGMGFYVFGAFGISVGSITGDLPTVDAEYFVGIPWTCTWIIAYPLIVPDRPLRTYLVGNLAALTIPLAVVFNRAQETGPLEPIAWPIWMMLLFGGMLCAAMGGLPARMIYQLGREVSRARELGSYQLGRLLGQGGMGEVWEARHRMLRRPAAIKLIRTDMLGREDSDHLIRRFQREAEATATLQSQHSIHLYDFGVTKEGAFYYVMELLDGIDLETFVMRFGPAPASRVVHWMLQACESIQEAHARGMIHRDIKPANLFTCRYGIETDFLKVLDFGLVKGGGDLAAGETRMTAVHGAHGTPAYMPPETALGEDADARSDLYALGCVAYWLLCGETVFTGSTPMQLVVQHAKDEPIPPSQRTELDIPADLEGVVMACLQKDRLLRPQSAADLARELEQCEAAGSWSTQESARWWNSHLPATLEASDSVGGQIRVT